MLADKVDPRNSSFLRHHERDRCSGNVSVDNYIIVGTHKSLCMHKNGLQVQAKSVENGDAQERMTMVDKGLHHCMVVGLRAQANGNFTQRIRVDTMANSL